MGHLYTNQQLLVIVYGKNAQADVPDRGANLNGCRESLSAAIICKYPELEVGGHAVKSQAP